MARNRRPPRDWYEHAFGESEAKRRADAAGRPPELPKPGPGSPFGMADFPRRSPWKWTLVGIAAILVAVLVRGGLNSRAPALRTSCTTPALALSTSHAHQGATVRWAATGPAKLRVLVAVGVSGLVAGDQPGELRPVPDPGLSIQRTQEAGATRPLDAHCKTSGAFEIGVPAGHYAVRLFRIDGAGAATRGTAVAVARLTVS